MRRILISEAGGALSNGTIESLRRAPEPFYLVGVSSDVHGLQMANTNERHLVPAAGDPHFVPVLNQIVEETRSELIISQHDSVVDILSKRRDELAAPVFLPAPDVVERCQDKYASYQAWRDAGLKVPETILLNGPDDLRRALDQLGPKIWIRELRGGFGQGAVPTDSFEFGELWINYYKGWGRFTAAELLQPESITWMSIWNNGELVVAQGRKRLYWKFANRNLSGVTGVTGTGVTISDPAIDELSLKVIHAVDKRPHGIFAVDLTYDRDGVPNPTEINIGRFFTTHLFFTEAGLNMPYIVVKLAFGEPIPPVARKINPLTPGLAWVREMDSLPVLTSIAELAEREAALRTRVESLPAPD
jgi:hypothetical protein